MKNYILLAFAALISISCFAQRSPASLLPHTAFVPVHAANTNTAAKTTGVGSTDTLSNISANDTLTLYYAGTTSDSGYATGTNAYGDLGFAERYDINGSDSSVTVTGIIATFNGVVSDTSVDTVNFRIWTVGPQTPADLLGANYYNSGFPDATDSFHTLHESFKDLGIPNPKAFLFFSSPAPITSSFFVGFDMNYSNYNQAGDTIGVLTSLNGERTLPEFIAVDSTDTLVNNVNVTEYQDGSWHDNATDAYQFKNDLAVFPIVTIGQSTGVTSITRNGLTFYGCYPNPAISSTNIQFSLLQTADVTIQVMDMSGRVISTMPNPGLSAGNHTIPVSTSAYAAGDYLYLIHTSAGDGIAGKFTVIK